MNETSLGYTKINPFLVDSAISRIDCLSPNTQLSVVRSKKKIKTQITLTEKEMQDITEHFAKNPAATHELIPSEEGIGFKIVKKA